MCRHLQHICRTFLHIPYLQEFIQENSHLLMQLTHELAEALSWFGNIQVKYKKQSQFAKGEDHTPTNQILPCNLPAPGTPVMGFALRSPRVSSGKLGNERV
mmetsp:Transcript_257/g.482  ORF Transcript_257/g.482 Transcript_257/m.482 type:complete len:101 (+) Transcript_257:694-996(+)